MEQRMPGGGLLVSNRATGNDARAFAGFFVAAGLVNATIAALLLCRLPESHAPSPFALVSRATAYVLLSSAAGIAGAYFYWRRASRFYTLHAPMAFMEYALVCAAGWVWVPAAVLLSTQDSRATALMGVLSGLLLGVGLRKGIPPEEDSGAPKPSAAESEMFGATLQSVPGEVRGYVIAGLIYAAGYAQYDGMHLLAGLLCAAAAFLFAWNWMQPSRTTAGRVRRDAGRRLAWVGPLAILLTAWALLLGVAHRNAALQAAYAAGRESDQRPSPKEPSLGPGGFESVILWPFPPKKQIIPPLPAPRDYLGIEKSRPLTIRFDGAYWYFQPPETQPGRTAHQAHGTPLTANIQSVNTLPLMMEAHQRLIGPVRLSRCGEIDVQIQNRDNLAGPLSIGLLLGDSQSPEQARSLPREEGSGDQPARILLLTSQPRLSRRFVSPFR